MNMKSVKKNIIGLTICIICTMLLSCKKFVEVDAPITGLNSDNVYNSNSTAVSVLTGIYTKMSASSFSGGGLTSMSLLPALSSDEISIFSGNTNATFIHYYDNLLTSSNTAGADFWENIYPLIFSINSAIEGISNSSSLLALIKKQLLGEAKFLRAFCFFYLVNLYGDVPLPITSDYKVNSILSRTPTIEVYDQIIIDLKEAKELLSPDFLDISLLNTTTERVRPNKWAAIALLARVYLFRGDYLNAEANASEVLNNNELFKILPLNQVFLKNSHEAIWQLQPVITGFNTKEARTFVLTLGLNDGANPFYLSDNLMRSFEVADKRKSSWIGIFKDSFSVPSKDYYYSYKYKSATYNDPVIEYSMVFRLAEQYLIRAESRVHSGNLSGAANDLNIVRNRAGLRKTMAATKETLLTAILHERQVELFTEWGHRWFDLKRTGMIDEVMSVVTPLKGGTWNTDWQLYPIPLYELQQDLNLKQNRGY